MENKAVFEEIFCIHFPSRLHSRRLVSRLSTGSVKLAKQSCSKLCSTFTISLLTKLSFQVGQSNETFIKCEGKVERENMFQNTVNVSCENHDNDIITKIIYFRYTTNQPQPTSG